MILSKSLKFCLLLLVSINLVAIASATDYIDYYHQGLKLYDQQKYQEAINSFEKCLKINNRFSSAYLFISFCHLDVRPQQAAGAKAAVNQMNYLRNNAKPWIEKGDLYLKTGLNEDAIDAYKKAISWDSSSTYSMKQLASIYAKIGYYDDAIQLYDLILEINPSDDWKIKSQRDNLMLVSKTIQTTPTIMPTKLITATPTIPATTQSIAPQVNSPLLKTPGFSFWIVFIGIILAFVGKIKNPPI